MNAAERARATLDRLDVLLRQLEAEHPIGARMQADWVRSGFRSILDGSPPVVPPYPTPNVPPTTIQE